MSKLKFGKVNKELPVSSSSLLLGDGDTFSAGAWVSAQAGDGVGLFMNLYPIRNFLLNRQFFSDSILDV